MAERAGGKLQCNTAPYPAGSLPCPSFPMPCLWCPVLPQLCCLPLRLPAGLQATVCALLGLECIVYMGAKVSSSVGVKDSNSMGAKEVVAWVLTAWGAR